MAQGSRPVDTYTVAVAAELRAAVERLELTQEEVAERAGLARSTVGKILNGTRAIDMREIALLAAAVGMRPSALVAAAEKRLRKG